MAATSGTISGKNGTVEFDGTTILDATSWSITQTSNNPAFGSTDTQGHKTRVGGVKDNTGTFNAKYNGAIPLDAGDSGDGVFTVDGTATYTVPIIIDQIALEVDMDDGDVVGYAVDWSGCGPVVIT